MPASESVFRRKTGEFLIFIPNPDKNRAAGNYGSVFLIAIL
jgi:hypothetical protein